MLSKIQPALAKLLKPDEPLLIGVSGSADSVALLNVLVKLGWRPHVCHLNHQLRGEESDADEDFVRQLAQRYDLPHTIESRPIERTEEAARQLRFSFFISVARRTRIWTIALAHTADDQVETFLLRLLRGAGVSGLTGIWPERLILGLLVKRPLLGVWRAEVLQYLKAQGLTYREDTSNADKGVVRNRIRHELLPLLEHEYNPGIRDVLLRTVEILRDEDEYLERQARTIECQEKQLWGSNINALAKYPVAVQRRILRLWFQDPDLFLQQLGFDHLEAVRHIALGDGPSSQVTFPSGVILCREGDQLHWRQERDEQPPTQRWGVPSCWSPGNGTAIPELGIRFEPVLEGGQRFDAEALGEGLYIRTWREGDRFQPLGMSREKKLQDFFVDEKVPREQRERVPLLCTHDDRIAWVIGYRIADPFKVTDRTHFFMAFKIEPIQG